MDNKRTDVDGVGRNVSDLESREGAVPTGWTRWLRVVPAPPAGVGWAVLVVAAVLGAYGIALGAVVPDWAMVVLYLLVGGGGAWVWAASGAPRSWTAAAVLAFWLVWAITLPLTMMWSPGSKAVQREVQGLAQMAVLCVGVLGVLQGSALMLERMRWWWAALWGVIAPLVAWELVTGRHLDQGQPEAWFRAVGRAPFAALINPNNLACVLVAVVGVTVVWARRAVGWARWVCVAVLVSCGVTVWFSNSRAAMAAYLVVTLVGAWSCWRAAEDATGQRDRRWAAVIAGAGLGVTVLAFVVPMLVPGVRESNPVGDLVAPSSEIGKSDASRIGLLRAGLSYFAAAPLLGKGAGSFEPLVAKRLGNPMNLHNSFVEILCQYGLVVSLPLLVALGLCGWALWRGWRVRAALPTAARDAGWAMVFLLLAYGLTGVIVSSALTMPLWWIMLAHAVACAWCLERGVRDVTATTGARAAA